VAHTFLMQPGKWTLEGNWLERDARPIAIKGRTLVAWSKDNFWFTMVSKIGFSSDNRDELTLAYKGRIDPDERHFTFVLDHSELGRVEGEGLISPDAIVQRYWVLGDKRMRTGFQTFYRADENHYHLSGGLTAGQNLENMIDAVLIRHPDS
jgi:hypothetical protein